MKHKLRKIFTSAALAVTVLASSLPFSAANAATARTLYLSDFGADASDSYDDTDTIQEALDTALYSSVPIILIGDEGTYHISANLKVYSDTTLILPKSTKVLAHYSEGPMLYGAHKTDQGTMCSGRECTHYGYTHTRNIRISGGIWDRNKSCSDGDNNVFSFRHAKNITIDNLEMCHSNDHFINISGVDTATVDNVTIRDAVKYTGTDTAYWGRYKPGDPERVNSIEAIHTDYCTKAGEDSDRAMPFDGTPSKNITVRNCEFNNVYSCIGTHHPATVTRGSNYQIYKNTFKNVHAYCIYAQDFDGLVIKNNTATYSASLCSVSGCKAEITNNKCICDPNTKVPKNGMYLFDKTTATVSGNTVKGAKLTGICVYNGSSVKALGNTVATCGSSGISAKKSCKLWANDNNISSCDGCGIYVTDKCELSAKSNEIRSCGTHALFMSESCKGKFNDNIVDKTGKGAVRADAKSSLTAAENSIKNAGEFAIFVTGSSALTATDNVIYGTGSQKPAIKVVNSKSTISKNKIKSSQNHGIVVSESNGSKVASNQIDKTAGIGIHIFCSKSCTVSNNIVNAASGHGLLVEGTSKRNASANLKSNSLRSTGAKDLRLGTYARGCKLEGNRLGSDNFSVDPTATYSVLASNISFSFKKLTAKPGSLIKVNVRFSPKGTTAKGLSWKTSNKKVATVSGGKVKAIKPGIAVITATTQNGKTASFTLTVTQNAKKVTLNKKSVSIKKGASYTLKASFSPAGAQYGAVWKSSNTNVVTVNGKGVLSAKKKGTATVTVTTYNGKKASCKVTVK